MRTGSGAGVLRLLFKDHLSSTVHVTDQAGNQVAGSGYFPFGATMRSTGTMPTDHLFTDQQQDGSGLYYYGARYNRTSWSSATRVWSRSFKEDGERWLQGPGGNLDQTCVWQERLPK